MPISFPQFPRAQARAVPAPHLPSPQSSSTVTNKRDLNPRVRRIMKNRQPKSVEDAKSAMFIRGHKTSQLLNDAMNDMVRQSLK